MAKKITSNTFPITHEDIIYICTQTISGTRKLTQSISVNGKGSKQDGHQYKPGQEEYMKVMAEQIAMEIIGRK